MEEDILEKIIQEFNLYKKQKITYKEFTEIYNKYGNKQEEKEFAEVLGIRKKSFGSFKSKLKDNPDKKITILTNRNLSENEINKKILELTKKYNLYKNKKISYEELRNMHEEIKTVLTEKEFANLLGITEVNVRKSKSEQCKMRIFKNCELAKEQAEILREHILNHYEGKQIYYKENENNKGQIDFLELYWPYRIYFSENEFANLLGISDKNLWYTKSKMANPKIKDTEKIKKVETIRKELENKTFITKEEIEQICKNFKLTVEDFITYYINKGDFFDSNIYKQALNINNRLCIKRGKIETKDTEKHKEMFIGIAKSVAVKVKEMYLEKNYEEDLQFDVLLFILSDCRDLIENFQYDTKLMEKMIWLRARVYAKIKYLSDKKEEVKKIEFNERLISKKSKVNNTIENEEMEIAENMENMENIENTKNYKITDEQLADIFKGYLMSGYSKETILNFLSKKLNLEKTEIIIRMKNYLIEKGNIKEGNEDDAHSL